MTTDITHHLNGKDGPASAYRDVVPAGTSHRPEPPAPEVALDKEQTTPWQNVQLSRHPDRPHTLDYTQALCADFIELHGDRLYGEDAAIIGGLGSFEGQTVMIIGHQKGRSTKENIARHFGMAEPEGYRKAERLMEHAARFGFPILTFIDTPGANPGMHGEEHGIGQAIASCLMKMLTIEVPIIATVVGEGGSGGALGIGLGDRVLMLEHSIYSVASPESAAAILWRDAGQASNAAETMKITAPDLLSFGIIDEIISEPDGGAHTDTVTTLDSVREAIARNLAELQASYPLHTKKGARKLLEDRLEKYERMGVFEDTDTATESAE